MDAARPKRLGPEDATLDGQHHDTHRSNSSSPRSSSPLPLAAGSAEACMHLVEGSGPGMTCLTRGTLRTRLRIAALVLCGGNALFLAWRISVIGDPTPIHTIDIALHVAIFLLLGVLGMGLCRRCEISLGKLRLMELAVFGLPMLHAAFLSWIIMLVSARRVVDLAGRIGDASSLPPDYFLGAVDTGAASWLILIFTYALFIPNSWRRAAAVIGVMAVVPLAISGALAILDETFAQAARLDPLALTQAPLMLVISAVVAVVGVHTIGSLRRQAFRAQQLGQYQLRKLIGSGGMGDVYLAEHRLLKRPCALKVIRPEKAGDPHVLARFEREVQATARLSHWNSVEIFDYGRSEDGSFYYVMEYLPGMNLQELIDRYGPLPPERAIHFLKQTCDALSEAHAIGLLHRDIKPANIFAAQRGGHFDVAKLLDFGLVKPTAENADAAHLTQEGAITGSPLFMAPEQALGDQEVDARADIYSLGVVAYFLLTGKPPFNFLQPLRVMMAHANEAPPPLASIRPELSDDLCQVVMRCLEKRPQDRYAGATELSDALDGCQASGLWNRSMAAEWWREHAGSHADAEVAAV